MKKLLLLLAAPFISTASSIAQQEKFDIATFTPPSGWQRSVEKGNLVFLDTKTLNGKTSFCQITVYPSTNTIVTAKKNFETSWQKLVATPTKSKAKPATQTQKTPEGWTVTIGTANITQQKVTYKNMLTNITGFGKTMNVQVKLIGNEYATDIENFFQALDLDPNATTKNTSTMSTTKSASVMFALSDYDFVAPEGWQMQKNKDHISIQNMKSGCTIQILEPQASSGNLEQDAKAVFNLMYNGWQYQRSGEQQYTLTKGFLSKGLEFCMMEAGMSKLSADGSRYDGFEEGLAMVVKANNQIAIIAARHNSSSLGHDECRLQYNTWKRFFNSFTVKNATVPNNQQNFSTRIIGGWSQTEAGASSEYIFAANGHYGLVGAIGNKSTSQTVDYEYLHIRTYAFDGDGTYSISGSQILLKDRSGSAQPIQFRFAQIDRGGTGWKDNIYLLKLGGAMGDYEVRYEKRVK